MTSIARLFVGNPPSVASRYLYKRIQIALSRLTRERPAVTYATYRSASSSIHRALQGRGIRFAVKAHALAPAHMLDRKRDRGGPIGPDGVPVGFHVGDWVVRHGIIEPQREADFVISIRDPVAVAASNFSTGSAWWHPRLRELVRDRDPLDSDEALALARESLLGGVPVELMRSWLATDVAPVLGFDPLAIDFDRERGAGTVESGPWKALLLRADIEAGAKSRFISAFLGRRVAEVGERNATAGSDTPRQVIELGRRALAASPELVDRLLDPTFTERFWTPTQIERMREKWCPSGSRGGVVRGAVAAAAAE